MRLGARDRLDSLLDAEGRFEIGQEVLPVDALKFRDSRKYPARLQDAMEATGETDALGVLGGAIRSLPDPKRNRIPIIALTADALPELRDAYMASGLDDYQTKPIDWAALYATILRHLPWAAVVASADQSSAEVALVEEVVVGGREVRKDYVPIDAEAIGRMRDELGLEVWTAVADIYWSQSDLLLAACRAAVVAQDATVRGSTAHSLKGSSASLGFNTIALLADTLQRCDPDEAVVTLEKLENAYSETRAQWSMEVSSKSQASGNLL
jgi:CheY-like chemotaxis protein